MKKKSIVILVTAVVLMLSVSAGGMLAYFSDTKTATNTFTVGNVNIELDETEWNSSEAHVIVPGTSFAKNPVVTVLSGSQESYVRMLVTVDHVSKWDEVFKDKGGANLRDIFKGYNEEKWGYAGESRDANADTITYEFRYATTVNAVSGDEELEPLFTSVVIPSDLDDELEVFNDVNSLNIVVKADAIQALTFADADAAWAAFSK